MSTNDICYIREQQRKIDKGFPKCQCSNCLPEEAIQLYDQLRELTADNFSNVINDSNCIPTTPNVPLDKPTRQRGPQKKKLALVFRNFAHSLVKSFEIFFWEKYPQATSFLPEHLFSLAEASNIVRHIPDIQSANDILSDVGGNPVDGQLEFIYNLVFQFQKGNAFNDYLINAEEKRKQEEINKKKKRQESRLKVNKKSDTQIAEEKACLEEKHAAATIEKERKSVAAEKRRSATIKRKETERKKAEKKQKWEADSVQLEGFKRVALENPIASTSNNAGPSSRPDVSNT
jgi:hypothetical protein